MAQNSREIQGAIAATRFGLGAKPGEIEQASADPQAWLIRQIRPEGADQPGGALPSGKEAVIALNEYQQNRQELRKEGIAPAPGRKARAAAAQAEMAKSGDDASMSAMTMQAQAKPTDPQADAIAKVRQDLRKSLGPEILERTRLACATDASFRERWTLFWCNHFTVATVKLTSAVTAGPFEREAIRPHVFGRFEDMLVASTRHPGMLFYLDQAQSIGPNSQAGQRRKAGLNENLAREILELHTLGADSGYTQADVTEFARALTGWSMGYARGGLRFGGEPGEFFYRDNTHEPGTRYVMGRRYGPTGERQAREILHDIANDPRTAKRIARKIAVHFVADDPPQSLVDRLDKAWTGSGGKLDVVARALVEAPEAWDPQPQKFKTPYELIVSGYRAPGFQPSGFEQLNILTLMGHRPLSAPSPKGWSDQAAEWAGADAIVKRLEWAKGFSAKVGPLVDPKAIAKSSLGARLGQRTELAVNRAESRQEALAVLLMSPEFQRR
ncbi:MAG: DUF1800 family protein [Proteobacteria bacterium]|nr:DUF1800 family protein [Pseudomonadota bacterium]